MSAVDAVIIGAGHNGLVAANLLADAGWSVVVLEAADHAGGAVHTAEVTAPGFANDMCSAFYPFAAASPVIAGLHLEDHGLSWRHAPHVLAHVFRDDSAAILDRDPEVTAASVELFAPGDGQRWLQQVKVWDRIGPDLIDALFTGFPPVRPSMRLGRQLGTAGLLRLARQMTLPARRMTQELFEGEGARLLLAGCAQHTDLSPDQAGSGIFGWLMAMVAQSHGFPVPAGGAGALAGALVRRLRHAGGEIIYGATATRVLVKGQRALGVVTADGRGFQARRAVLADVAAPLLYRDLVDQRELPDRLLADLENFSWDNATVKVDWALSAPVPWRNRQVATAGTVHLDGGLEELSTYALQMANQRIPQRPFILAGQMTTADPSRSPVGTEAMWAYTHLPWRKDWQRGEVLACADRVEEIIEEHAPGFRSLVAARTVQGPDELAAGNASLVGGAIGGGTSAIHQELFFRPIPGLGRADTPIDRLYLCNGSAHPGGGVHGGPGANAARAALARNRPLAGNAYAAMIQGLHRRLYSAETPIP
ncbi:MAG TPA: NAD(P)/FAD-dependent oxidoreductase [Micromonosporaceae bacterium]